jgi:RNA polymerase sigma-70 factor (ECF subfamily)
MQEGPVPTIESGNEDALVERLRQREESAVIELVMAYRPKILQMAMRYLKNREDAEEVAQDVLVKVWSKIGRFRGDAAFSSWIYRIAFNTVMSRLRRSKTTLAVAPRKPPAAESDAVGAGDREQIADWSDLADERLMRRQMRHRLARAIQELPSIYRVPIILRDLQGLSTEEASRHLRLRDETLKSRLHRGRLMLRQRLADFSGGTTLHRVA